VKDTPFDINALKSKWRWEIQKGCGNFICEMAAGAAIIEEHKEALFSVAAAAFADYPEAYWPEISRERFYADVKVWEDQLERGVIDFVISRSKEGTVCGYAVVEKNKNCMLLKVVKTNPAHHKQGLSAAIAKCIVDTYLPCNNDATSPLPHPPSPVGLYICDGERPLRHQTNYQEYLCKYFGFRYVYCKLRVKYAPVTAALVAVLFPFRRLLAKLSEKVPSGLLYNIVSVLEQERIRRTFV